MASSWVSFQTIFEALQSQIQTYVHTFLFHSQGSKIPNNSEFNLKMAELPGISNFGQPDGISQTPMSQRGKTIRYCQYH